MRIFALIFCLFTLIYAKAGVLDEAFVQTIQSLKASKIELKENLEKDRNDLRSMQLLAINDTRLTFINTLFTTLLHTNNYKNKGYDLLALAMLNCEALKKYMFIKNGRWRLKLGEETRLLNSVYKLKLRLKKLQSIVKSSFDALVVRIGEKSANDLINIRKKELMLKIDIALKMLRKKT